MGSNPTSARGGRGASKRLRLLVVAVSLGACASPPTAIKRWSPPGVAPDPEGLVVTPEALPSVGAGGTITLAGGGEIHTVEIGGVRYVPIEATFSESSWQMLEWQSGQTGLDQAGREDRARSELTRVLGKIGERARVLHSELSPSVGWVSALVPLAAYPELGSVKGIGHRLLVNPVVSTPIGLSERKVSRDDAGPEVPVAALMGSAGLVGLERMGVTDFLDQAAADLGGLRPDGSKVTLGIADTGITYAHPAFRDAAGKSRIDAMRDFTGEGRIFFTAAGRFEIAPAAMPPIGAKASEALTLSADYLISPNSVDDDPDPTKLRPLEKETILVGPKLRALLLAPNASGARFGVLSEAAFKGDEDAIDLDQNGKTDDLFYAILVPAASASGHDAVWLATTHGDFRNAERITSFEVARATQPILAERIGLEIKKETLTDPDGNEVPVTTAAVVGFDPGRHGSHVAGIASARKIIDNAPSAAELHGVAPGARIASGRICANTGGCNATKAIIALAEAGADVINMSIGSLDENNDGYGVQEAVIDRLTMQHDTVFVISAGNEGPGRQTVGSPSVSRLALSVAASASPSIVQAQYQWPGSGKTPNANPDADDFLLFFSSRGPSSAGGFKPDITAPGTWLSTVPLSSAPGVAGGLDVMWGTSMAAPATAGAVTLLLDAARRWNELHPAEPLTTDARTIRRVMLASARPFDETSLDLQTGETKSGRYTFVDEGLGMVNLARAWQLLKAERSSRAPSVIHYTEKNVTQDVPVDWQVRVLRTNPNGLAYDGSRSVPGAGDDREPQFGRGVWLDANATDRLIKVQVARRLPSDVVGRLDAAELAMQLKTTAEELELETVIQGSQIPWVSAGGLTSVDCTVRTPASTDPLPHVLIVGEGAVDVPVDPKTNGGGSEVQASSLINVCVDRAAIDGLPPGDHAAIVRAYRVHESTREAVPAFVFPVYVTVPNKTLVGASGYHVTSSVDGFGVARNYIEVPKGTSLVKLSLSVPEATVEGTAVSGCAGVELEVLEGKNTATPPEYDKAPGDADAQNCYSSGKLAPPDWRSISLVRTNPNPGIWDVHVFGLYAFPSSPYTLDVEFAKVVASTSLLEYPPSIVTQTFDVDVLDASYALVVSKTENKFNLTDWAQVVSSQVAAKAKVRVADKAGAVGRVYSADIENVTIATRGSDGNDLDLEVLECDNAGLATCRSAASSAGPTDVESATFTPKAGKFYVAEVEGYTIAKNDGAFELREAQRTKTTEAGVLSMTQPSPTKFSFTTTFDAASSAMLANGRHTSGAYTVDGEVAIKDDTGTTIVRIPVLVH